MRLCAADVESHASCLIQVISNFSPSRARYGDVVTAVFDVNVGFNVGGRWVSREKACAVTCVVGCVGGCGVVGCGVWCDVMWCGV